MKTSKLEEKEVLLPLYNHCCFPESLSDTQTKPMEIPEPDSFFRAVLKMHVRLEIIQSRHDPTSKIAGLRLCGT